MESDEKQYKKGVFYVVLAGVLWGTGGVVGQFIYQRGVVTPEFVVTFRFLLSGILLVLLTNSKIKKNNLSVGENKSVFDIFKEMRNVKQLIIFAIFGAGLVQLSYYYAIYESNAATATFLQYTSPAVVIAYLAIRWRKLPSLKEEICCLLAIAGVFFIATHGDIHSLVLSPWAVFWGLVSSVTMVVYTLYPTELVRRYTIEYVLGWSLIISGVLSLIILRPWMSFVGINSVEFICLILVVIFGTIIPFSSYSKGVMIVGGTKATLIATLEPLSAAAISFVALGEVFEVMDYVGFGCILMITFLMCHQSSRSK